jgi:hypothetical protein
MTHRLSPIKRSHWLHPAEPVLFRCAPRPKTDHATAIPLNPAAILELQNWNQTAIAVLKIANRSSADNDASTARSQPP